MSKILITGSSGFLGNNLTNYFHKKDNQKFKIFASYNKKKPKFPKKIKIIKLNSNVLKKKSKKFKFDIVIHCASKTRVNSKNNYNLYEENVNFLNQIINKIEFKYIYFMSSMSVYGSIKDRNIKETTNLRAKDYYGKSKIECENILKNFSEINNKKKIIIFRLPGVVGLNSHSNFISNLRRAFQKNLDNFLTINNQNDKFNNILHSQDLYFCIKQLLNPKYKFKLITLVPGTNYSLKLKSIIKIFTNFYKKKIQLKYIETKNHNKLINLTKGKRLGLEFNTTRKSIILMLKENNKKTTKNH